MSNDVKGGWTPGPWEVSRYQNYEGFSVWAGGRGCIAERGYDLTQAEPYGSEIVANAHLIASAPELFEALQVLLEFDGISAREKARAAIAKATRGTPTP